MRRIVLLFALVGVVLVTGSCTDQDARDDIQATQDTLNSYHADLYAWQEKVSNAVCQLEVDVYDITYPPNPPGVDINPSGPFGSLGSYRLCPSGPGDDDGRPPSPPEL